MIWIYVDDKSQKKISHEKKKSITKEPSGDTFENWNTAKEKKKR
jgi:hypothetical protein